MPVIQIFGTNKCQDTRAAQRFFKERRIVFQFIDLNEKGLSQGEFNSVKQAVGLENLLDTEGKEYQKQNLKYMKFDIEQALLENPKLFKTPIVRNGRLAALGYQPEIWKKWLKD